MSKLDASSQMSAKKPKPHAANVGRAGADGTGCLNNTTSRPTCQPRKMRVIIAPMLAVCEHLRPWTLRDDLLDLCARWERER